LSTSTSSQANINKKKALAKSFFNKRDFANAGKLYSELCRDTPDAESHYMMGVLYGQSSNPVLAEQHLSQALQFNVKFDLAWSYLGIIQASQGKFDVAINSFNSSLKINPKNIQSLNNLGNVYRELGDYANAESCYKKSLKLDKKNFITINNIANIYLTQCLYDKAENYYKKAIKLNREYFDAYYNLGATYQSKGEHKLAIKHYKMSQKLKPDDIQPQSAIANSYEKQGNYDKALELLKPLLAKNIITPDIADIYSKICIKNKDYDEGINIINKCLTMHINPIHEQSIRFSLGDIQDKQGEHDKAFREYLTANKMRPYQYDKTNSENSFNRIKNIFSEITIEEKLTSDNPTKTPVFIVGMPRSGTSLIEQILSSHSQICGAGELPYLGEITEQIYTEDNLRYPDCIKQFNSKKLNLLSESYLSKLKQHGSNCKHITDKMPHNFLYIGLIQMLFPNSKIIHCLRNPLDVCLSIYFHNFNQNHPYSDNLSNLGHYYNQYRNLMEFWHNQYDNFVIDISYEGLLSNENESIKKMLTHIDVEWEDECLKYYENKRTVSTPSYAQVTQPLYKSSMERWRNYADYIDELKMAVDDKYL